MEAVRWTGYGPPDVLRFGEVAKPVPDDDEVLIRVRAATVSAGDCEARRLDLPLPIRLPMRAYVGWRRPRRVTILGQELAGEVEAVGTDVTTVEAGDRVFAATGFRFGAYAEYACLPEESTWGAVMAPTPKNATNEEAATLPVGGLNALYFIGKANVRRGERVLVNGAAGSIGTVAVQLATSVGAHVTAVDAADKLDLLGSLGANEVVDYAREDFTRRGETYDVVLDVVGSSSFSRCEPVLEPGGRYLSANPRLSQPFWERLRSATSDKAARSGVASYGAEDLRHLADLVEDGTVEPVVDRTYPLEETAEAHRYVESGRKRGNVAISIDG